MPAACVSAICVCLLLLLAWTGLSTYMPLRKEPPLISDANLKTPIFQAHGDMDYTVSRQGHARGTRGAQMSVCLGSAA
jgi:hypothetical protein